MKPKTIFLSLSFALTFSTAYAQDASRLESKAREWLAAGNASKVGVANNLNFKLENSRKSISGETLRFQQTMDGVPIYEGDFTVHFNKSDEVTYASEILSGKTYKKINTVSTLKSEDAFAKAVIAVVPKGEITYKNVELFVFNNKEDDSTRLVYRVVMSSYNKPGEWETIVDAQTGAVLRVQDISNYHTHKDQPKKKKNQPTVELPPKKVTGTAYVFDPDPLSKMQVTYAGQYVDNNDATNASLDAARSLVTLPDLDFSNGMYNLKGKYAQIIDFDAPSTGLFSQATPDFLFNRFEQGFEAVNAFYHINKSMAYINETLGIECKPTLNGGLVQYDPHGNDGDDNSYFMPSSQRLSFGEGGVDDAEDADVIIHELGHGIHHWITGLKSSSTQGLGEGSGDYWAMSYSRSLNQWPSNTPQYNWVFSWDGHNEFWPGRVTNYAGKYPSGANGAIHTAGQIWSTTLMRIWDKIGREKTDRIFLEGLAMTNSSANQQTAAVAVRQAGIDMLNTFGFKCADINIITAEMTTTGYTMPAYTCVDMAVNDVKKDNIKIYPNPAKDILNVNYDINKESKAIITTMDGRQIMNTQIKKGANQINVSNLPKGVYLISAEGVSQKFIKE